MTSSPARRAFVLVIDACGAGALPDAADYGDEGTCTLAHLAEAHGGLELPVLGALGLGSIVPHRRRRSGRGPGCDPRAPARRSARARTRSPALGADGRDARPAAADLPAGFPPELVARLEAAMGHEVICNRARQRPDARSRSSAPSSCAAGGLILYTSQDSVLQLAAHAEVLSPGRALRGLQAGARSDGGAERGRARDRPALQRRARPLRAHPGPPRLRAGAAGPQLPAGARCIGRERDRGRQDRGPVRRARSDGLAVRARPTRRRSMASRLLAAELEEGLVFANLIETDQVYGHRKDVAGLRGGAGRDRRAARPAAGGPARGRSADRHGRPRRRPGAPGYRSHARVRAAAGCHRGDGPPRASSGGGYGGGTPRRADGGCRRDGADVADRHGRGAAAGRRRS